jgi:hypothetical protein
MLRRWKFVVAGVVAVAAMVGAPAALSDGNGVGPQKACPSDEAGWFLTPPSPGDTVVDRNGDGLICVKGVNGRGSSRDVPGFSVTDDLVFVV